MNSSHPSRSIIHHIFVSPTEPRLRAGWRILLQLVLMFFIMIIITLLLSVLRVIVWNQITDLFFVSQIIQFFAITLSVFIARRYLDRRSFSSLGLGLHPQSLLDVSAGILITALMMLLIYFLEWAFGWLTFQEYAWSTQPPSQVIKNTILMFLAFVIVGWQEELFSRGYHLQNIADGINLTWGVILSSAIFSLLHISNPSASVGSVLGIFAAGLFLAFPYILTKQLWLSIGLHIGWNFFEGTVFGFAVSGLQTFRLFIHQIDGPIWATGGDFGPEGGAILIPALLLGVLLVWLYVRERSSNLSHFG